MKIAVFKAAADAERLKRALEIRTKVFVEEQGVPISEEIDAHDAGDPSCLHVLVEVNGTPAATGRLYRSGPSEGKIGRMAVLPAFRGAGTGMAVLDVLIKEGWRLGLGSLVLDAQIHAVGFYAKRGFVAEGSTFLDAGLPHKTMRLRRLD